MSGQTVVKQLIELSQNSPTTVEAIADLADPATLARAVTQSEVLSPLRYPGGKRRLAPFVAGVLHDNHKRPDLTVEPFAGGASIALYLLQQNLTQMIGLADADPLIASFWKTVFYDTDWLIEEIGKVPLTLAQWEKYKARDPKSVRQQALACLFLNRTSFSGILSPKAGPLGGKSQTSKYKIGCRFPRQTLQERVRQLGAMRERVAFVHQCSWIETLNMVKNITSSDGWEVFTYLDPPFFFKADKLYRYFFDEDEHTRLRNTIIQLDGDWLLSYDSVPRVAELYLSQKKLELGAVYTASTAGGYRKVNEAVVSNLHLPDEPVQPRDIANHTRKPNC